MLQMFTDANKTYAKVVQKLALMTGIILCCLAVQEAYRATTSWKIIWKRGDYLKGHEEGQEQ